MIGNALFFAAIILIYYSVAPSTFDLTLLQGGEAEGNSFLFFGEQLSLSKFAFGLMVIGIAIRVPIFPFYGWFKIVSKEAPTSVFIIVSSVLTPVGLYLFCRLGFNIFPTSFGQYSSVIVGFGLVTVVVSVFSAIGESNLRLFWSNIAMIQVGLMFLGMGSLDNAGVVGFVFQILTAGLSLGAIGFFVGAYYNRTGNYEFTDSNDQTLAGGLVKKAPILTLFTGLSICSFMGFPGMGGFIGNSMIYMGSFSVHPVVLLIMLFVMTLVAFSFLSLFRKIFLGSVGPVFSECEDIDTREKFCFIPVVTLLFILGVYPKVVIEVIRPTVLTLLSMVSS